MVIKLFSSVRKRCWPNLQFDMPDLNTGFALVARLMNTLFQKNAARWNIKFDIGKQRNTLFRFMNTLVQFCGEHAGSVSCRFCVLDLLLSDSSPQYSNEKKSFVKGKLPDWTFSSIKWEKHASSIAHSLINTAAKKTPRDNSRCNAPPDWLKTTMARIVPSLQ